jgi:hypothetical protein
MLKNIFETIVIICVSILSICTTILIVSLTVEHFRNIFKKDE